MGYRIVYSFFRVSLGVLSAVGFLAGPAGPEIPRRVSVLFVGNSLTYVNDMPRMVADMAAASGYEMRYKVYAPGGRKLSQHAQDPVLLAEIARGIWDYVILQEQSQMPSLEYFQLDNEVYPSARFLSDKVREANPKARVVFYMTMAHRDGDAANARYVPELKTYAGTQERINRAYVAMAEQNNALLAPAGEVWQRVRTTAPEISLYADEAHPNLAGSYLVACVIYAVLFHRSPPGLPHPSALPEQVWRS